MFKDLYKQANDKIDTESPKSRVMARLAKKSPAPARKSYKAAKVAALAACLVITIAAAGIYENVQKKTEVMPGMIPEMSMVETGAQDAQAVDVSAKPEETAAPVEKRLR